MQDHIKWMQKAILCAKSAQEKDEVPVGAIIVKDNKIIASGYNLSICNNDPTAHAEIIAIRNACEKLQNYRLTGCDLYCTLEPCMMCAGSMVHARIKKLIYAAPDPKSGVIKSNNNLLESKFLNHKIEVKSGVLAQDSANILKGFFETKRLKRRQ